MRMRTPPYSSSKYQADARGDCVQSEAEDGFEPVERELRRRLFADQSRQSLHLRGRAAQKHYVKVGGGEGEEDGEAHGIAKRWITKALPQLIAPVSSPVTPKKSKRPTVS